VNQNWPLWLSIAGYGLGTSVFVHAVLSGLVEIISLRLSAVRRRSSLRAYDRNTNLDTSIKVSLEEILEISNIPWITIYGVFAALALAGYVMTRQIGFLIVAALPMMCCPVKGWRRVQRAM